MNETRVLELVRRHGTFIVLGMCTGSTLRFREIFFASLATPPRRRGYFYDLPFLICQEILPSRMVSRRHVNPYLLLGLSGNLILVFGVSNFHGGNQMQISSLARSGIIATAPAVKYTSLSQRALPAHVSLGWLV